MRWPWRKPTYEELEFDVQFDEVNPDSKLGISLQEMWCSLWNLMNKEAE